MERKLSIANTLKRVGRIRYAVKDGIVYEAKLLTAKKKIADQEKAKAGFVWKPRYQN